MFDWKSMGNSRRETRRPTRKNGVAIRRCRRRYFTSHQKLVMKTTGTALNAFISALHALYHI